MFKNRNLNWKLKKFRTPLKNLNNNITDLKAELENIMKK